MKNKKLFFLLISISTFILKAENDLLFFNLRRAQRRIQAHTVKAFVAEFDEAVPLAPQSTSGDERRYADLRGTYGKALPHFKTGFINPNTFNSLIVALQTSSNDLFNQIPLGGSRKLVNPQASYSFTLAANDTWINALPPAPSFASAETAGEMVENYWASLLRDIPFNQFDPNNNALVAIALTDLNNLTDFKGPKIKGEITPQTLFRSNLIGDLEGPYISQFIYQTIPYGATDIGPEQFVPLQGTENDFMTTFNEWFTVINGGNSGKEIMLDPIKHFIRTPRDLAYFVRQCFPGQEGLGAILLLLSLAPENPSIISKTNPYFNNPTQEGFVTYAITCFIGLMRYAVTEAMKACWYQKWQVHRRLRPEEFGFYVQKQKADGVNLDINNELLNSLALQQNLTTFGTYFLAQAYAEGCPTHPSYPEGHSTNIGAAITIVKALFNENFVLNDALQPLQPNNSNTALIPYNEPLTVGGELNKLASNVAQGRCLAGVHYRSDGIQGLLLGEAVAIDILKNEAFLNNENFAGYQLTKFDGTRVTIGAKQTVL